MNANGKVSGGYMGWGEKGATTLDPVLVIMHEMTHAMRLDHAAGAGWSTGNLEEPIGVGKHDGRTPSADDITQASASATDGKLPPTVSYTLLQCYPDAKALAKALDELRKMRKTARDEYDAAAKITTPRPRESGENSGQYNLYLEEFNAGNTEAKATAAKAQAQALSNIEYIENLIAAALGRICPPPATATPSHSSRLNAPEGPMQSGSEGFYAGLGGGMRSTACNNWHTKRVESTPGVDDAIGENPDACFSTAGRVSVYVGYTWSLRNNFMAGIETDAGYSNANTTRRGIPGTVGSIVSAAGSVNDSVNVKENWDGSVRGRLGYNVNAAITVYATTGLAWQQLHATITCGGGTGICGSAGLTPFSASQSTTRVGWTLGGGAEVKPGAPGRRAPNIAIPITAPTRQRMAQGIRSASPPISICAHTRRWSASQ